MPFFLLNISERIIQLKILAFETSCDETAAAIVEDGRKIISSVVSTQIDEHKKYGGVVPEIASRRHTEAICFVYEKAMLESGLDLSDIDAVAVTAAPGLIGALLVGVNFAKGLAYSAGKPLIPVHHIRGHIAANYLAFEDLAPPFLCLVASGGHSHIVRVHSYTEMSIIGRTRDDAAGEAFDKAARAMGFEYPGGIHIDRAARRGRKDTYRLPQPHIEGAPYDVSFSGLKTFVVNLLHNAEQKGEQVNTDDLCACFENSVCTALCSRLMLAAKNFGYTKIVAGGGICANTGLREALASLCAENAYSLFIPPVSLCSDNAAMIASQAYYEFLSGVTAPLSLNAAATMSIEKSF